MCTGGVPRVSVWLPMRAPRIWSVARDPRASLGRRGAHGADLMGVFWALLVATVGATGAGGAPFFSISNGPQQILSQRRWPVAGCFDQSSTRTERPIKKSLVKCMKRQFTDVSKWQKIDSTKNVNFVIYVLGCCRVATRP